MDPSHALFTDDPTGVIWIENVRNPGTVTQRKRLLKLFSRKSGAYLICDPAKGAPAKLFKKSA